MEKDLTKVENEIYDICIIGGGIYGAWAALDAAQRGLSVIIVEQSDWGSATSQSSSKLLHGGLRYLEQFEFGLVRKSLKERDVLAKIVPHLVKPLRFIVPLYQSSRVGPFKMRLGLKIYDQLAGQSLTSKPHKRVDADDLFEMYPWLEQQEFKAALEYSDAQTDDSRLTFQIIQAASSCGVDALSYTEATITHTMDRLKTIQLYQSEGQKSVNIQSKCVLMTTGPWKDAKIGRNSKAKEKSRLTKGVHLILPSLSLQHAMTLMAPDDGRVFFLIPWYGRTMVGTTDTDYRGDVQQCKVTHEDVAYILKAVNTFMANKKWREEDVIASFCGLRVLQSSDDTHPSQASREWSLPEIRPAVFRSIGGKLTSAREDAVKAMNHIVECLNFEVKDSSSHKRPLQKQSCQNDFLSKIQLDEDIEEHLIYRYGQEAPKVVALISQDPELAQRMVPELAFIWAEVEFIIQYEPFYTLEDLLRRRLPLILLCRYEEALLIRVADIVQKYFNWPEERCLREKQSLKEKWIPFPK
jgi:glycerol-3-phosphate dehydrogenase